MSSNFRRERVERGIYRCPNGKLEIGWRDASGRQRWKKVDGGVKAARAALAREHAKRASGGQEPENPRLTFSAAADAWWGSPASLAAQLDRDLRTASALPPRPLRRDASDGIGPSEVLRWLTIAKREGTAGTTLRKRLTVLGAIFDFANRHLGHPGANPVRALDRSERPKSDSEPKRTLTDDELAELLDAIPLPHRLLFELLAETGMRKSEAAGLTWDHLDLSAMTIAVRRQLAPRSEERVELKTRNSARTLVITPRLAARLREHNLASGRPGPNDLVSAARTDSPTTSTP